MRFALSHGVSGTRAVTGGSTPQPRGRVVARAVDGEVSDVFGGLLDSLNSSVPSMPAPPQTTPPAPVVPSQPDLPSIESLAQKFEYPSSKAASAVAPAAAPDVNPLQPLLDALNSAEMVVENAFDDTAEALIDNFNSLALPPSLQGKVDAISTEYAGFKASVDDAPEVYLFLFSLLFGSVGYAYYRNEYGGFSGIYKPTDLVEALNKEDNIIVVDIRSEAEQDSNGVLDLRRAARGKAVSLPIVEVPDAVRGDVRNSGTLQRKLSAALVCSLANVNAFTKIVLMDTRGASTKALAREINSQGYRAYCLKGGFTLWRRTGLSTKTGTYDVSAGAKTSERPAPVQAVASEPPVSTPKPPVAEKVEAPAVAAPKPPVAEEKEVSPASAPKPAAAKKKEAPVATPKPLVSKAAGASAKKEKKDNWPASVAEAAAEAAAIVQDVPKPVVEIVDRKSVEGSGKNGNAKGGGVKSEKA